MYCCVTGPKKKKVWGDNPKGNSQQKFGIESLRWNKVLAGRSEAPSSVVWELYLSG